MTSSSRTKFRQLKKAWPTGSEIERKVSIAGKSLK